MNESTDGKKVAVFAVQNRLFNQTYFYYGCNLYRRADMDSLVGKLKALSEQARRVQTQFDPKTSDG